MYILNTAAVWPGLLRQLLPGKGFQPFAAHHEPVPLELRPTGMAKNQGMHASLSATQPAYTARCGQLSFLTATLAVALWNLRIFWSRHLLSSSVRTTASANWWCRCTALLSVCLGLAPPCVCSQCHMQQESTCSSFHTGPSPDPSS